MSEARSSKLEARSPRSPLALYLLAVAEQSMPSQGPWTVADDPEDLLRVVLTGRSGLLSVRVGRRQVEVEAEPMDGWSDELEEEVESALAGVYCVGDRQLLWHNRTRGSIETPAGGEER